MAPVGVLGVDMDDGLTGGGETRGTQFQVRKHMDPHLDRWKGKAQQPIPIHALHTAILAPFSFSPANLSSPPNIPRRR